MDRIERHDILNALFLALLLLLMAFVLSFLGRRLFQTVQEDDFIDKAKNEEVTGTTVSSTTSTTESTTSTTEAAVVHTPAEVKVIVVNAARVRGIATKGTNALKPVGYQMLTPTNGDTIAQSVIFYLDGFEGDAVQVATLLNMAEDSIQPMPESISFNAGEAQLAAVIGGDHNIP